ncbi:hypothetical protein [Nostoc piscinale]|nr:hypothetical protein [Nostoc piscinale]
MNNAGAWAKTSSQCALYLFTKHFLATVPNAMPAAGVAIAI